MKHKSGICLDYAFLMDSLCKLAGIKNVSIYGYVKDNLFDVNDSLYMDNHAWNTVKLDNLWYVYDVTWASGGYALDYTKFSKRLIKWCKKLKKKHKTSKITFNAKYRKVNECDSVAYRNSYSIYKRTLYNKFLLRVLRLFKLRLKWYQSEKINFDYYLTVPELFAIDHFPDNPDWSLTAQKKVKEFEGDSAFYHLDSITYKNQKRVGRSCGDCDNQFSFDGLTKESVMKRKSSEFNKRNKFITSFCNTNISHLLYLKSVPIEDSLRKINLIDSSLIYINESRDDLYKCRLNVMAESQMQKTKNKLKYDLLFDENRTHLDFIRNMIRKTYDEGRKINYFNAHLYSNLSKFRRHKKRLYELNKKPEPRIKNFKTGEALDKLKKNLFATSKTVDSLCIAIRELRTIYDIRLTELSKNLFTKEGLQDSLITIFLNSIDLRRRQFDNYKKQVVELRKGIVPLELKYDSDINELIYAPSGTCSELGTKILKLIEERNDLSKDAIKLKNEMVEENLLPLKDVELFVNDMRSITQEDICWLIGKSSKLRSAIWGYRSLLKKQKGIEGIIKDENRYEFQRYKGINIEITRRKRKYGNIARHNIKFVSKKRNFLLKYKRDFLKSLKAARKAEKKGKR